MPRICTDEFHASLPLRTVMRFAGSLSHQPKMNPASASCHVVEGSGGPFNASPRDGVAAVRICPRCGLETAAPVGSYLCPIYFGMSTEECPIGVDGVPANAEANGKGIA